MFTFQFDENSPLPKYDQLYRHVRDGIAAGVFAAGDRLPSKRKLAAHLRISLNTVESAYAQLVSEGYVDSAEKKGFFVLPVASGRAPALRNPAGKTRTMQAKKDVSPFRYDMKNNAVDTASFPFATWSRLMRDCLREDHAGLLKELEPQGDWQLREAIACYLGEYRDIGVSAEQIVLGAGTSYLLGILVDLLPAAKFAIEDPGYAMIARTLQSRKARYEAIPVDDEGMSYGALRKSGASACILTPSNHFPLGTVMSIKRRTLLLDWAENGSERFLIEDDYDSDYRYELKPAPALCALGRGERVVYLDTFARTLTPSLRIAYMVLPRRLLEAYRARIRFYSCTVSAFEQRTLWRFIRGGQYERHLNRMRTIYKRRRNIFLEGLDPVADRLDIFGTEAGLHLLLRSRGRVAEKTLVRKAAKAKVKVYGLSGYYHGAIGETNTVVAGYGGLGETDLARAAELLCAAWK